MGSELLIADQLQCGYGRKRIVFDACLSVGAGEIVSLVGHNGAGKSTLLKTIFGMLPPHGGRVHFDGTDVCGASCRQNVRRGMSLIPAERFVFGDLSVFDNLRLGAARGLPRSEWHARLDRVYALFPALQERTKIRAGSLSGGQQRMLSMGMSMMQNPRLLLLDEPSLGLAPAVVSRLFRTVRDIADDDRQGVLLVEQNLAQAFAISDRVYVMRGGRVVHEATAADMRNRDNYWDLF